MEQLSAWQTVRSVWQSATRPHTALVDIEQRRQSRLLAGLTLAMLITTAAATLLLTFASSSGPDATVVVLFVAQVFTLALYLMNRAGHYRLSATLFVGFNFALVHGGTILSNDVAWLLFTGMMLLLSASLMPVRITSLLFLSSIVLQIALHTLHPMRTEFSSLGPIIITIITGSMVLVFMNHRAGLESERRAELSETNRLLRESEIELEKRVIERTQELVIANEKAESARQRAEQADQIKSQFLASMSHELRTPLNAILTFSELMAVGTFGPVNDEQIDYLQKSMQSGKHLLSLINDVLDITKIQAGMMKLFIEDDFSVIIEVNTVAVSAEKLLRDKPVKLVLDIDRDFPPIACDKRRVRQVLLNLMSNAVKFTEEGTITLSAKKREKEVLFAVIDTGPGIAPQQQGIIFEPFVQTETGIRHAGGSGLGLPISKRLVAAHQGRLWVESEIGQGAAFFFTLPYQSLLGSGEHSV
ncbi:MAG: hypothetical protein HY866_10895 [Chloroflexi bacterium]|nr:hypothetical protein [Chloroflexota bacterium]